MLMTMHEVVDEVGRVVAQHDIAWWLAQGRHGATTARTAPPTGPRLHEPTAGGEFGFGEADYWFLIARRRP